MVALACIFTGAVFGSSVSFSKKFLPAPNVARHADLNDDGREDLVSDNTHGGFDVLLSTGDGTYGSPASYTIPGGADTFLLSVGDFNSDGKTDVVAIGTDRRDPPFPEQWQRKIQSIRGLLDSKCHFSR